MFLWLTAAAPLIGGGYWLAGYPGIVVAVGVFFTAMAVANEINRQLWPIGIVAIKQLSEFPPGTWEKMFRDVRL